MQECERLQVPCVICATRGDLADVQFDYVTLNQPKRDILIENALRIMNFFAGVLKRLPDETAVDDRLPFAIEIFGLERLEAEALAAESFDFICKIVDGAKPDEEQA